MKEICRRLAWLIRATLAFSFAIMVLGTILGMCLAWRLSQGPLDLDWAARRLESAANARATPTPGAPPTRLAIGSLAIRWRGFATGVGRGLELAMADVRLLDRSGATLAAVGTLDANVSMTSLLLGQIVPRAFAANGVELHLIRAQDGGITLDLGGIELYDRPPPQSDDAPPPPETPQAATPEAPSEATLADTLAELARPPRLDETAASPGVRHLQQLRRVRLSNTVILVQDKALGGSWRADLDSLEMERQPAGGVRGSATARLALGAAVANVAVQAELTPDGGTELRATLAPVAASSMQQAANTEAGADLGPQDLLDAAVQANATLRLDRALRPVTAALHADAGTGRMRVAGTVIGFDQLAIDTEATWTQPGWTLPQRMNFPSLRAVVHAPNGAWPTIVTASGAILRHDGHLSGTLAAALDHLAFTDIASLWPARLGGHVRPWLVENITAGTARNAAVKLSFEASHDLSQMKLTAIDGTVTGDDTTIWWLKPVPPVEHAQAVLTIKNPQVLDIAITSARQGAIPLKDGAIHITGLDVKDQFMTLGADVNAPVTEVLALLRHPHIRLLDKKPLTMRNPGGTVAGRMSIYLPLNEDLSFEEVKISAKARITDLRLGGLIAGRDLDRGDVRLDLTPEGMTVAGQASISAIAADLSVSLDFRDGGPAQIVTRAKAVARATPRQLAAASLDPGGIIESGTGLFTSTYAQRRDNSAELLVVGDLRDATLGLAGWTKPAGQPAEASARLVLRGDRLLGIENLRAQGPGMAMEGRAQMVGDRPLLLVLDRIVLGATQAAGQVRFPAVTGEPIRATLNGAVLDIAAQLATTPANARPPEITAPWIADVKFDRVLLAAKRGIAGVVAHAEHDGHRLSRLEATSAAPEQAQVSIRPEGAGRRVTARAADGGALLRALDIVDTIQGGALTLDGLYDDHRDPPPLTGTAELTGFRVRNAPALGKLLQAVTIYGIVDVLSGPGLAFSQATIPFRFDTGMLDLTEVRAFSASLGLTARGRIDQRRQTLDLQGTVVPLYVLNSFLGRIPILGKIFSAERGGGLVAVNYGLRGPIANPSVSVNPLSALTPGFLRGLFHIFD